MSIKLKLVIGFLLVVLLPLIIEYQNLIRVKKAFQIEIRDNSLTLATEIMDKIDRNIFRKIEIVKEYTETTPNLKKILQQSNHKFASLGSENKIQTYIDSQDKEWVAAGANGQNRLIEAVVNNDTSSQLREIIRYYKSEYGYNVFGEIFVTNKYGANVAQTGRTSDYRQNDEVWWQKGQEAGVWIGDVEYDKSAGVNSLDIIIKIKTEGSSNEEGQFIGMLKAVLNIHEVYQILDKLKNESKYESYHVQLLDKHGQLLYPLERLDIVDQSEEGEEKLISNVRSKGYRNFKGLGWSIIQSIDKKEIFRSVDKLEQELIIFAGVTAFISIMIGLIIAISILRPIFNLVTVTQQISQKNDYSIRAEKTSNDEVGILIDGFNNMLMKIQDRGEAMAHSEAKLKESELRLRQVIDLVPHNIFAKDIQGRFHLTNSTNAAMYNTTVEQLVGKYQDDVYDQKETKEQFLKHDREVIESGQKVMHEEAFVDKNGKNHFYLVHKMPFIISGEKTVLGVGVDITELKNAQQEIETFNKELEQRVHDRTLELQEILLKLEEEHRKLEESELHLRLVKEQLQLITDSVPVLIAYVDKELRFQFVNRPFRKVYKHYTEEIIGSYIKDIISEESYKKGIPSRESVLLGNQVEYEDEIVLNGEMARRKISLVPHQVNGIVEGYVGLVQDVTEYRAMEIQLREIMQQAELANQAKNEMILRTAIDGYWEYNREGQISKVNDSVCTMFGYSRDELLTMRVGDLKTDDIKDEFQQRLPKIVKEGGDRFRARYRHKGGEIIDAEVSVTYAKEQDLLFTFIREITTEIQLEKQLQQVQKMDALGTLAGGIAHDFNNILLTILGNTELLMLQFSDNAEIKVHLEQIAKGGKRATNLVKQILTFSRMDSTLLKPINLVSIVIETLEMARASIPANIEIRQNLGAEPSHIMADATQIHQVILNLCTNAYHAMEETGGVLEVTLKKLDQWPPEWDRKGECLLLTVEDTGYGISYENQEKVFDPFFTTKPQDKGIGLGLSVVHGIIEKHQARITVESQINKGTTFSLFFPISEEESLEKTTKDFSFKEGSGAILIVEDEQDTGHMYKIFLEGQGYTVSVCGNGIEALTLLKDRTNRFDLVFTDQAMPHMTGKELAQTLVTTYPHLPIILSTGYSEVISEEEALKLGICKYLIKPFNLATLQQTIEECLQNTV